MEWAKRRLLAGAAGPLAIAVAVTSSATADMCGAMPCRTNGVPYVNDKGAVIIYPGEHFAIAFNIENGKIVDAVQIPVDGELTNALELNFTQGGNGMFLAMGSHLAETIKLDATMKAPDDRLVYTSTCPVEAGMGSFETWPHTIKFLELSNFRLTKSGSCE